MLQELLNLGLMEIGSDDSRFTKMQAASEALVVLLKKDPSVLVPATMIALDNDVHEGDPVFSLVEHLVINEWNTLRNAHVNRPRALLRSIIIQSLAVVAEGSPEAAGIVWHTAVSPFKHGQVRLGKEAGLIEGVLSRLGEAAEREAVTVAGMVDVPTKKRATRKTGDKRGFELQSFSSLKDKEFIGDVARAAGPNDGQGAALSGANPYWPGNQPQLWASEFSQRMTSVLVKAVNVGVSQVSESLASSIVQYDTDLEQRLTAHLSNLDDARSIAYQTQQAGKMRLDVLWWSTAKYSPSLKCGYREIPQASAALVMAHDLAQLVPALAPASVTYVLGEATASLALPEAQAERRPLAELLSMLADEGSALSELFPDALHTEGRAPLLQLVIAAAKGNKVGADDLRLCAGVDPSLQLQFGEFAMWLFHDLQAQKLVEGLK